MPAVAPSVGLMRLPHPPLLVISDRSQAQRPLLEVAAAAFAGGCRWFSLREKDLPAGERRALLAELVALGRVWGHGHRARRHQIIDPAGADGVLCRAAAMPRRRAKVVRLIGASARHRQVASRGAGADYVTIS
jgi:thiamine-phosphate pyrophosphorylase